MEDKNILKIQTELGKKREIIDKEKGEIIVVDKI